MVNTINIYDYCKTLPPVDVAAATEPLYIQTHPTVPILLAVVVVAVVVLWPLSFVVVVVVVVENDEEEEGLLLVSSFSSRS
jgi:hypothetical protein